QPLRALFGLRARGFDKAAATLLAPLPNVVYVPFDHDLQPKDFAPDGYHPSETSCTAIAKLLVDAALSRQRD
ncbi:MAG: hypothetical protein V2J20_05235, partial [Wenzhouxiangella sp.]|nr:hypothetical protein [Wenzhouxiangella sp.]